MRDDYNKSNLRRPVNMIGDVIQQEDGSYAIEWNDPARGYRLYTEQGLSMLYRSSTNMLIHRHKSVEPEWTLEVWATWRDFNINAELGLLKLQEFKRQHNIALDTPQRSRAPDNC